MAPNSLGAVEYWRHSSRGPEAMREEARTNDVVTMCAMCQRAEKTSKTGRRIGTVAEAEALPGGKRGKYATPEEVKAYERKHRALVTSPRYEHVDKIKREVGCCQNPACPADGPSGGRVEGFEVCYDFNHLERENKPRDTARDPRTVSRVCGSNKNMSEAKWKGLIDEDRSRCNMLCANCHAVHSFGEKEYND